MAQMKTLRHFLVSKNYLTSINLFVSNQQNLKSKCQSITACAYNAWIGALALSGNYLFFGKCQTSNTAFAFFALAGAKK